MANEKVIEGTNVTVPQLKEFFAQIASGAITRPLLQGFLRQVKRDAVGVATGATFLTSKYFFTRPGLYVSDDFTSRITSAYPEALVPRRLDKIESFDLEQGSLDTTILARPEMGVCVSTPLPPTKLLDLLIFNQEV